MSDFEEIKSELLKFRDEREWKQFHNGKDLAIAINIESSELLELFLWKNAEEVDGNRLREELADVFAYAFLLAEKYQLDVKQLILDKINQNALKYPVGKSRNSAKKWNEL
jgi:NTP pyrophosphatase (non-canonical NTP hydrolase)